MKKQYKILALAIIIVLITSLLFGCSGTKKTLLSTDEDFAFSYGINKDGFWDGIKALKNVDLCEYTGIHIPKETQAISDEAIMSEVNSILGRFKESSTITNRAIADGDTINIDYVGSVDGVEFKGGSTNGAGTEVTIGVTSYIDNFLEQLIGHSPGESFDINVTFPEKYSSTELAGKDAVFAITVNSIIEKSLPKLTDAFVLEKLKGNYGWTSIDSMKADIRETLKTTAIDYYLQDYIIDHSTIKTLPDLLVEYQEFSMLKYYEDYAEYYGMKYEEFLKSATGLSSTEELLEKNLIKNTRTATLYLLMQAIAEDAGIKVTEKQAQKMFSGMSQTGSYAEYEKMYGMPHLKLITLQREVIDYVKESIILD